MAAGDSAAPEPRIRKHYPGLRFIITFRWLLLGAALYALLLLVAIAANPSDAVLPFLGPEFYLTPVFGLPLVIASFHRRGRLRRLIYFVLLLPIAHAAAIYLAWSYGLSRAYDTPFLVEMGSGAIGGVTGAVLAFVFLHLSRLDPRPRAGLAAMTLATGTLGVIGALGMAFGLTVTGGLESFSRDPGSLMIWLECVHLPWQVAFSLVLAWLMRRRREPKAGAEPPLDAARAAG